MQVHLEGNTEGYEYNDSLCTYIIVTSSLVGKLLFIDLGDVTNGIREKLTTLRPILAQHEIRK